MTILIRDENFFQLFSREFRFRMEIGHFHISETTDPGRLIFLDMTENAKYEKTTNLLTTSSFLKEKTVVNLKQELINSHFHKSGVTSGAGVKTLKP